MTITEMKVQIHCDACGTKIKKALQKLKGVDDVIIDINMQKVTVMGWAKQKKVLKTARKTGTTAELWPYPYNPEYHSFSNHYNYLHTPSQVTKLPVTTPRKLPSSSYNYKKHGYNGDDYGYYQQSPYSTIIDDKAVSIFSDDNPHSCSIM